MGVHLFLIVVGCAQSTSKTSEETSPKCTAIVEECMEVIKDGMRQSDVERILGAPTRIVEIQYSSSTVRWYYGSRCSVMFNRFGQVTGAGCT